MFNYFAFVAFRNMESLPKMPERDKIQKHKKKTTKNVRTRLFFIADLLARMWKDWRWTCGMSWSRIQPRTWRFVYLHMKNNDRSIDDCCSVMTVLSAVLLTKTESRTIIIW